MKSLRALILLFAATVVGEVAHADENSKPVTLICGKRETVVVVQGNRRLGRPGDSLNGAACQLTKISIAVGNPVQPDVPPEQAVVIDLHRPWVDAAKLGQQQAGDGVWGRMRRSPSRISRWLIRSSSSLWVYRLALPIDVKKYPMLSLKYRATNVSKRSSPVKVLAAGVCQRPGGFRRTNVWNGSDIVADGQEHEAG